MPLLVFESKDGSRARFRLEPGKKRLIGSDPKCSIRLEPGESIEPLHCEVFFSGGLWQVRDLGSLAGTHLNGRSIGQEALANGDVIQIGDARLAFVMDAERRRAGRQAPPPANRSGPRSPPPSRRRTRARFVRGRSSSAFILPAIIVVLLVVVIGIALSLRRSSETERPELASRPDPGARDDSGTVVPFVPPIAPPGDARRAPSPRPRPVGFPPEATRRGIGDRNTPRGSAPETDGPGESAARSSGGTPRGDREPQGERSPALPDRSRKEKEIVLPDPSDVSREAELTIDIAEWRESSLVELTALAMDRAEASIAAARREGAAGEDLDLLESEVRLTRETRAALERGFEALARTRKTFEIATKTSIPPLELETELSIEIGDGRRVRVLSTGEHGAVELGDSRGKKLGRFRALSLPDEVLLGALLAASEDRPLESDEARARLALLLYHAEGPKRARSMLGAPSASMASVSETSPSNSPVALVASRLDSDATRWIERKAAVLTGSRMLLENGGEDEADPLAGKRIASEFLSVLLSPEVVLDETFGELLSGSPSDGDSASGLTDAENEHDGLAERADADKEKAIADRLREGYLALREETISLATLFRASAVERIDESRTRLVYDFSDDDAALAQAEDLRPVGDGAAAPRTYRRHLVLQGEYRLLDGDPFVQTLTVDVAASSLAPDAPNINLALWTSADDRVTCRDGEETSWFELLRKKPGEPADFFVFGMGYRTVVCSAVGRPSEDVVLASTKETVALPALVLLGGTRGSPLHKDLGECLIAEKFTLPATNRVECRVDWQADRVVWQVNGRAVDLGSDLVRARVHAKERRQGSVTILTNGRAVALQKLTVAGELDPDWVRSRTRALAERELQSVLDARGERS